MRAPPDHATLADTLSDEVIRQSVTDSTTTWRCWWSTATRPTGRAAVAG